MPRSRADPAASRSAAVLSGRHPGQHPIERLDLEALAGEVLLIKDPGHFVIDSGLLYVVATAVVGDLEDFEGEVFRLTRAREGIRLAVVSRVFRTFGLG